MSTRRIALVLCLCAAPAFAGPPALLWNNPYAPATGADDQFGGAVLDLSGNLCVLRYDNKGNLSIVRYATSGGFLGVIELAKDAAIEFDSGLSLMLDASGDFIIGGRGRVQQQNSSEAPGAIRYTSSGAVLWATAYWSTSNMSANGAVRDGTGAIYVASTINDSGPRVPSVTKITAAGAIVWSVSICDMSPTDTWIDALAGDPASGYYVCGWTNGFGSVNPGFGGGYVRKYDAGGAIQWTWTAGPTISALTVALGSVYAVNSGGSQYHVTRLNASTGAFQGNGDSGVSLPDLVAGSIAVDAGGTVYVGGAKKITPERYAGVLMQFRPSLSGTIWGQVHDSGAGESGYAGSCAVVLDAARVPYLAGMRGPLRYDCGGCSQPVNLLLRKFALPDGSVAWMREYDGAPKVTAQDTTADASGNVYMTTENPPSLIKFDGNGNVVWSRSYTNALYCLNDFGRVLEYGGQLLVSASVRFSYTYCGSGGDQRALNIARYNSSGYQQYPDYTWTPSWGDTEGGAGPLAIDAGANLYLGVTTRTYTGGSRATYQTVVKFTAGGSVAWSVSVAMYPGDMDGVTGIGVDAGANAYVGGPGMDQYSNTVMRVTKVQSDGTVLWSLTVGGSPGVAFAYPTSLAVDRTAGRIYVAGLQADNFSAPTLWRGVVLGLDTNGNTVWSRTNAGSKYAFYWDVAVDPSGTVFVTGMDHTAIGMGDKGPSGAGTGDILLQAFDPTDACFAPAWSARWDSGPGNDDYGQAVAAGSVFVLGDTPAGTRLLKFQQGQGDSAVLAAGITVSPPGPVDVGTPVAVFLTVSNTGARDAMAAASTLMISSGAAGFGPLLGPWTTGSDIIGGGASKTWFWTTTATAAAIAQLTATGTGTDSCSGAAVAGGATVPLQAGYRSVMGSWITVTPAICGIGDWVRVDLTVTNGGTGAASLTGVTATVFLSSWPLVTRVLGHTQGSFTVNAGNTQVFSWTFSISGFGPPQETFTGVASGMDPVFGYMSATAGVISQIVDQARLAVAVPASGTTSVGGVITYQATVTNLGASAATGVTATILMSSGGGAMKASSPPVPPGPVTILPGSSTVFTWTMTATGAGPGTFTVTVTGTDTSVLGYPLAVRAVGWGLIQTPAAISVVYALSTTTIEVGQTMIRTMTVSNSGQAAAHGLRAGFWNGGTGSTSGGSPTPSWSATVVGFQSVVYSYTLTGLTPGTYWQTRTVTGFDANTGYFFSVPQVVQPVLTILSGPALAGSLAAFRSPAGAQAHVGQSFLAMLTVTNTGGVTAANVSPAALVVSGAGGAVPVAGPMPAGPATLAPGAAVTFTWTLSGSLPGFAFLSTTVSGVSTLSGTTAYSAPVVSNGMDVRRLLTSWVTAVPNTINGGQTSLISMTISNTGVSTAAVITPNLAINPPASATAGPPSATNLTLAPGQSQVVTWNMTGLAAATVTATASATAVDALDTSYPVSTAAAAFVVVNSSMAAHMVVTPASAVAEGGNFRVELTVTNWGGVLMQNLTPKMILNPGGLAVAGPPAPALVASLLNGNSATFTWTGSGKAPGTLTITVVAAGTPFAGSYDSVSRAYVLEIRAAGAGPRPVVPAFEGDAIVYPNPVGGDAVSIAVRLKADATLIEVDVYNTGYQRVWHGEFPGQARGDWPLDIGGVSKWAPGVYLVRIRAKQADGGTQVFPTLRMGVKRK